MVEDSKPEEGLGFEAPTFVYHPKLGAKIVDASEKQGYYDNGWYDTPEKFPKPGRPKGGKKPLPVPDDVAESTAKTAKRGG